jgi:hypothetical protein
LDRRPIPGVTTLLGKGLPKPAIPYWAAKSVAEYVVDNPEKIADLVAMGRGPAVAALKGVPWEKRDQAAVRGTDVHDLAEQLAHGQEVDVPEHLVGHVEGYAHWLDAFDVEALHTEVPVASRKWWYAGKFDLICRIGRGPWAGYAVLADNKTSKGVYGETALQTAAYASAEFMAPDADTEIELPAIEATGVIHVTEAGSQFYPLADSPERIAEHFKIFQHIAYVAKRTDDIKGFIGEPMPEPESEPAA